jgi:hypothetical protein
MHFYISSFVGSLLRRFNSTIPSVIATDTAAKAPNPAMTPIAADESKIPLCAALVVAAVIAVELDDVEPLLDRATEPSCAVTVTICVGVGALMKTVAVTVGLVDAVSDLEGSYLINKICTTA